MAIDLPKRDPSAVIPPRRGEVTLVADQSGNPVLIDEGGGVNAPFAFNGSPVQLFEQFADPPVVPNGVVLYSKLKNGTREAFSRSSSGQVHQLTPGNAPKIQWKGDNPGAYYVSGDTVDLEHGCVAQIQIADGDTLQVNFPAITPESAGLITGFANQSDKKLLDPPEGGSIIMSPDAADRFGANNAVGADATPAIGEITARCTFQSDGVGSWQHMGFAIPDAFVDPGLI